MSLREEQCKKVCRILDDSLANKPTERDSLIVATRNAFKALAEPHWIPVTERLPEEDTEVLVTGYFMGLKAEIANGWNAHNNPSRYVEIASYNDGVWSSVSDEYKVALNRHKVLAWMPLPAPWKGEVTE